MNEVVPAEVDRIFISDVHLGGFEPQENKRIEERLLGFLKVVKEHDFQLTLLGDLFDYWMEYRGEWPRYGERVLEALEEINKQKQVLYITGNHDNWTGPRIERAGFDLEQEYRMVKIGEQHVLMLHGDGLKDTSFSLPRARFHRLLRNPYFLSLYQGLLPPRPGIELMRQFSRKAKLRDDFTDTHATGNKLDIWAEKTLERGIADVVMCGHHHKPVFRRTGHGLYINLGNFYHDSTMAVYTSKGFRLVKWIMASNRFELLKS